MNALGVPALTGHGAIALHVVCPFVAQTLRLNAPGLYCDSLEYRITDVRKAGCGGTQANLRLRDMTGAAQSLAGENPRTET